VGGYLSVGVEGAKIGEILVWFWCVFHTNIGTTSADGLRYEYAIGEYTGVQHLDNNVALLLVYILAESAIVEVRNIG
jgi:hypothetical protein